MMNIVIIEDEPAAVRRLKKMVSELMPEAHFLAELDSVEASVDWLESHPSPDLMFMDIHLADGPSFDIFESAEVKCPVIFITAYDQYALKAFEVNSVDYLLKPIKEENLKRALDKYQKLYHKGAATSPDYSELIKALSREYASYQKRIVIRYGQHIKAIEIDDVAYFYIESKVALLRTHEGKDYPVDHTLDQLDEILDPRKFFRINRKFIIGIEAISQMYAYSKSRVKLDLIPPFPEEVIVSGERSPFFKEWLLGK